MTTKSCLGCAFCFVMAGSVVGCDASVEGAGGAGGSTTSATVTTSTAANTPSSSSTTVSSSSGGLIPPVCPNPSIRVTWTSGPNGPSEVCKTADALNPTNYQAIDTSRYAEAFQKLRDHQAVTIEFHFDTAFNSDAGYLVTSKGDGTVAVSDFSTCDMAPRMHMDHGATLAPVAALDTCSTITTAPEQIECVRSAFAFDGSNPACSLTAP